MTYVSWAAFYEGVTDQAYFELLIPRVMEDIVRRLGTRHATIPAAPAVTLQRGPVEKVAKEACKARESFHLVFIHADTGGRSLEAGLAERSVRYCKAMQDLCGLPMVRCITIAPRHETEAWLLADPQAVTAALGYLGSPVSVGLPGNATEAEGLDDPKKVLADAVKQVRRKRDPFNVAQIFPAIAQRQSLANLRDSRSFVAFETALGAALADLGCI